MAPVARRALAAKGAVEAYVVDAKAAWWSKAEMSDDLSVRRFGP